MGETIAIDVTFERGTNCREKNIDAVRITVPNSSIGTVVVPCVSDAPFHVVIPHPGIGKYAAKFEALYRTSVIFVSTYSFELTSEASAAMAVNLSNAVEVHATFTFASVNGHAAQPKYGMTCAEADVETVSIKIDGGRKFEQKCADASLQTGATFQLLGLTHGPHTFEFEAATKSHKTRVLYSSKYEDVVIMGAVEGAAKALVFNLEPRDTGRLQVRWKFPANVDCEDVRRVMWRIVDEAVPTPNIIDEGWLPCAAGHITLPHDENIPAECANRTAESEFGPCGLPAGVYVVKWMEALAPPLQPTVVFETAREHRVYVSAGQEGGFDVPLVAVEPEEDE